MTIVLATAACGGSAATPITIYVTPAPTIGSNAPTATAKPALTLRPPLTAAPGTPAPTPAPTLTAEQSAEEAATAARERCDASSDEDQRQENLLASMANFFVDTVYDTWSGAKAGVAHPKYDPFFRNSEDWYLEPVYFKGEVIQTLYDEPFGGSDCADSNALLDGSATALRVNVTRDQYGFYDDTIYVIYLGEKRILEDDVVEFAGIGDYLITYESTLGASITIPEVVVGKYLFVR